TVVTSVLLASFDATRRLPLLWSIALATRRPPLNCNLLTTAFLLLCSSIFSRIQVKGKRTRKKERKGTWEFWPLEHMACLNFDCECFNGVLNLLRYSNVFELNIGSELRCGGTFLLQKWNKSMKMSFQNAIDQVWYLFPHLNLDSIGLDHCKVVKEANNINDKILSSKFLVQCEFG
ncbi:hypothetical protein S83_032593, partial [Arachis hypogaea]